MNQLTAEQLRLIEENKRKALERLAARKAESGAQDAMRVIPMQSMPPASSYSHPIFQVPPQTLAVIGNISAPPSTGSAIGNAIPGDAGFVPFQPTALPAPAVSVQSEPRQLPESVKKPEEKPVPKMNLRLEIESGEFFTCPHAPLLYDLIKAIPGAVFCHQDKQAEQKRLQKESFWRIPLVQYQTLLSKLPAMEKPSAANLIPDAVLKLFANPGEVARRNSKNSFDLSLIEEKIRTSLFPFQREGVQLALARNGKIILADDMGLGKSIQSLAIASYYRREWPMLIMAPASMVSTWHEQVQRWFPELDPASIVALYDGKGLLNGQVNIGSYDLLTRMGDQVAAKKFQVVIVDESHALKNPDSKRSKSLIPVISRSSRAILLSGTPALSRPIELFSQIKAINPKLFPNYYDFGKRYCNGHQTHFGWDMKGSSNTQELQVILENTIMIRRTKGQVLSQLPPKIRQQIFLKVDPRDLKIFASINNKGALLGLDDLSRMESRNELMDLWRKTGEAKAPAMLEYIEDLLEAGHKCLVFAHHKNVLDIFEDSFMKAKRKYIRIDGNTNSSQRQEICTKFQSDPLTRIALLSITAASTGLTLTAATTVVFAELYWNPGQLVQAEDRAHRIGQCDSVNVHYLLAKGTTDDTLWPLILKKLNTLESVGLGKNDFKGISNREHDPNQLTLERAWKKPKLEYEDLNYPEACDNDTIVID